MKKIAIFLVVVGMISAIITATVQEAKAQSFSISPYAGMSADQQGLLSTRDPAGGVCVQAETERNVSFGINMNGGMLYRVRIGNDSSKVAVYKKVNAPALTFVAALNIPDKNFNIFAGPVIGVEGGVAFPNNIDYGPAGVIKVFTQVNLGGNVGDYHLAFFAQGSFNFLYMSRTTYSSLIALGARFTIPRVF